MLARKMRYRIMSKDERQKSTYSCFSKKASKSKQKKTNDIYTNARFPTKVETRISITNSAKLSNSDPQQQVQKSTNYLIMIHVLSLLETVINSFEDIPIQHESVIANVLFFSHHHLSDMFCFNCFNHIVRIFCDRWYMRPNILNLFYPQV